MELFINDLSIDGQFPDVATFRMAIGRIMTMRDLSRRFGHDLYCNRNIAFARVTQSLSMEQAINACGRNEARAVMQWITRLGPFWEDAQLHSPGEYLEYHEEIVTDTAVGEAAYYCFQGLTRRLVSLTPSRWEFSPIQVIWRLDDAADKNVDVFNYWTVANLDIALQSMGTSPSSWEQLATVARQRCSDLTFSADCFEALRGHPFVTGAANQALTLLTTLNRFKRCFDDQGQRTLEGHQLYHDHFTGEKAWFSDSSDTEKAKFCNELTFPHPYVKGAYLFCSWHGKVKTPQIRIHFSWPVRADEPLYIVYVGPKITKR